MISSLAQFNLETGRVTQLIKSILIYYVAVSMVALLLYSLAYNKLESILRKQSHILVELGRPDLTYKVDDIHLIILAGALIAFVPVKRYTLIKASLVMLVIKEPSLTIVAEMLAENRFKQNKE